jgi:arylsulfatase A-like enzyme
MVVFYSDNGGLVQNAVYFLDCYPEGESIRMAKQTPLREGKGWLYEGGIRVPLAIRWPGEIQGGTVSNEVVSSYDFMPTFCDVLNVEYPSDIDGISLITHLKTGEPLPARSHYWHFPHYHRGDPSAAVRSGKWKLIEWYEPAIVHNGEPAFELYDLTNDISESLNLADSMKDLTAQLAEDLEIWRQNVDAQRLMPNSEYGGQ